MSTPDDSAATPGLDALRAAGVAHDVNQMLAVIRGRAELLLRQPAVPTAPLEAILLAARDAAVMLERLRVDACATAAGPVAVAAADVGLAVDEAAAFALPPDGAWAAAAAKGRWALLNRVAAGTVAAVPAPVLREVLTNLLLNALRALPDGGVVTVDGGGGDTAIPGARLRLRVADDGPGLPGDDPEQVFAVGYSTSGAAGRGVGLAACRQLLAAHDGALTAAARGGPGAVFTLELAAAGLPAAAAAAAATPRAPALPPGLTVLVVDDEVAVRDMLTDVLGELGCRALCYRDGAAALAAVAAGAVSAAGIALVDRRLPGLDGGEVAARLRAAQPALAVVAMTGWEGGDALPAADTADFALRKPLGVEELAEVLGRAAALHEARRSGAAGRGRTE